MSAKSGYDVLIIGAGMYGLQAARTYLEVYPNAKLVILEGSEQLGGAWSQGRVYDTLWTQDSHSVAEFSDVGLPLEPDQLNCGLFRATHMTTYLEIYAHSHKYAGSSVADRIRFACRVTRVSKLADDKTCWVVETEQKDGRPSRTFQADKVIDASGITSEPALPDLPNLHAFRGTRMHAIELASNQLQSNEKAMRIVVAGGAKSAADAAYALAKAGKIVHWVVRKSGGGPCWYAPLHPKPPFTSTDEPLLTRVLYYIMSSHFVKDTLIVRFMNRTAIGRWLTRFAWKSIEADFRKRARYDRNDAMAVENGFKNLIPDTPLFWANDNTGVEQRDDFFDTIATKVRVYRDDITEVEPNAVVLSDGTRIETDAMVFGTGWRQAPSHYDAQTALDLGLPVPIAGTAGSVERQRWDAADKEAEKRVLQRFPILADPPRYNKRTASMTPYRLYRCILPIQDPSIVSLGRVNIINGWRVAEVQSLWAVAALNGRLPAATATATNKEEMQMRQDVADTAMWCARRYLDKGAMANWFLWDCVAYTDALLDDLGLVSHLGKEGLLQPCRAQSLRGLIGEYKARYGSRE
ncbi:uncharacterized protein B0I36DRAFT_239935 [Microdochium trichocladiopsis]|uniref:FAD/NAD(P)-binding domain-containing protein n=1 Tax=Microdochium trichocladiopsis TaxID=1682393 RepID=A0A9P8YA72_9PEZI|nr:uncharacterized protein B0I36DRAFT_239935 [Microdochium trichocladiopsis]KAH7034522.1 hypothetical protein B0I36DRAFT_239935 [Microdochium trichocladiopsis]